MIDGGRESAGVEAESEVEAEVRRGAKENKTETIPVV